MHNFIQALIAYFEKSTEQFQKIPFINKFAERDRKKYIFVLFILFICIFLVSLNFFFSNYSKIENNTYLIYLLIIFKILSSIGFLGIGWVFVIFSYGIFRSKFRRLMFFLAVLTLGIVVYTIYDINSSENTIILSYINVNNTLSSFFPSRGDMDSESLKQVNIVVACCYAIFHSIAYLTFAIFAMSHWGRRLANIINNEITLDKFKYIFWVNSADERSLHLGHDIHRKKLNAEVVIEISDEYIPDSFFENRLYDTINKSKIILDIYENDHFPVNSLYAPYHLFISDDEKWNMKMSYQLLKMRKYYKIKSCMDIYIMLGHGDKIQVYDEWLHLNDNESVTFHIFNEAEITARNFVYSHPTLAVPSMKVLKNVLKLEKGSEYHVLFLGFGWQGYQLLRYITGSSQFVTDGQLEFKSPFYADIIDMSGNTFNQYSKITEIACEKYNIHFEQMDVMSDEYLKWMKKHLHEYDRIIISLGDDERNLDAYAMILKLRNIFGAKEHLEIFIKKTSNYNYIRSENVFGTISSVYSYETILDEGVDVMAKYLNARYAWDYDESKKNKDFSEVDNDYINEKWNQAKLSDKYSSREAAEGIKNCLYLLGYEIKHGSGASEEAFDELKAMIRNGAVLSVLAKNEHLRWEAYKLMLGVRPWLVNSDTTYEEAMKSNFKSNQEKINYRHAALVDYEDLPKVDAILKKMKEVYDQARNEGMPFDIKAKCGFDVNTLDLEKPSPLQNSDIHFMEFIPEVVKVAGYSIRKIN
jgi:hypothetical protein